MAWQAANYRLHDDHALLQPHIQGRGPPSEDRKEEGRHKGPCEHTRQRGRAVRHQVHLSRNKRQLHAQAVQLRSGRPAGHGQGVHRLRQV